MTENTLFRSSRRALVRLGLAALLVGALGSGAARAAEPVPFTAAAFQAAQAAGAPILVEVHADWCAVCTKQKPILSQLAKEPAFADIVRLRVDFDTQRDVLQTLKVDRQSTLIAFKGAQEQARTVGLTDPLAIRALVARTKG